MKLPVIHQKKELNLISFNLCSIDGHGDYEVVPDQQIEIDMQAVSARLQELEYQIQGANEKICMAQKERLEITVYPGGRVIIEQLIPDDAALAIGVVVEALDMEQAES